MFTSVISDRRTYFNCFDAARLYVLAAVNVAVFSAIYEHFSFGVYSPFMIFAFAVPLLMGALPFLLLDRALKKTGSTVPALVCKFWHAGRCWPRCPCSPWPSHLTGASTADPRVLFGKAVHQFHGDRLFRF